MPVITLNTFFGFVFGESAGPRLLSRVGERLASHGVE